MKNITVFTIDDFIYVCDLDPLNVIRHGQEYITTYYHKPELKVCQWNTAGHEQNYKVLATNNPLIALPKLPLDFVNSYKTNPEGIPIAKKNEIYEKDGVKYLTVYMMSSDFKVANEIFLGTPETCVLGRNTSIHANHSLWNPIIDMTKEPEVSPIHGYRTDNYNKLIAKFMDNSNVKDLKYDVDWNVLIPVIEKIETLGYTVHISSYQTQIYGKNREFIIDADFSNTFLENTYQAVWSFIEWYNKKTQA